MGVASFCLVAVFGLVPLGIGTNQASSDQTACSNIITHVLADLRATPMTSPPGGAATSTEYRLAIPAHSGATTTSTVLPPVYFGNSAQQFSLSPSLANSRYRLTVTFVPATGVRTATGVTLLATWPPLIDPNNSKTGTPAGRVQVFANLDRN